MPAKSVGSRIVLQVVLVGITDHLAVRGRHRVAGDHIVGRGAARQEQHHGVTARIVHQVRGQHIGADVVAEAVRRTRAGVGQTSEPITTTVVVILQRRTAGAAVRHHHHIHNLCTVLLLKLLHHLHRRNERMVKRSVAQPQPIRERRSVEAVVGLGGVHVVRQHPQLLHRVLVGRTVHGAAGEVVQEERRVSCHTGLGAVGDEPLCQVLELGGFLLVLHRPTVVVVVTVVLVAGLVAAESVHIERHTDATEERGERVHLLHHIQDHATHRTRPIQQHNEAVVLAVGLHGEVLEQVLVPLVGGQEVHIQRSRLGVLRTVVSRRRLLQHERLDHRIHGGLGFADESGEFATGFGQPLAALGAVAHRFTDLTVNGAGRHDDLGEIVFGQDARIVRAVVVRVPLLTTLLKKLLLILAGLRCDPVQATGLVLAARAVAILAVAFVFAFLTVAIAFALGLLLLWVGAGRTVGVIPHKASHLLHILKGFGLLHKAHDLLLLRGERDGVVRMGADLEVEVDAVDEVQFGQVARQITKHLLLCQPLVALHIVTGEAGVLGLDEPFDAGIFDDVDVLTSHLLVRIAGLLACEFVGQADPATARSVESVAHLVGQEQIVHLRGHARPPRHIQGAGLGVEPSVLALGVEQDGDVLRRHQASEHGVRAVRLLAHGADGLVVVVVEHGGIVPQVRRAVNPYAQDFRFFFRLKCELYIVYFNV